MDVDIQIDKPFEFTIDPAKIEAALRLVFELFLPQPLGLVSVVITDEAAVHQLNRQYRGVDAPTDVLSFEGTSTADFLGEEEIFHLGDIIIAYPVAARQAADAGHAPVEEVILLAIHGALHLLGFDHDTPAHKRRMWAAQKRIMAQLKLAHIQPTET